MKLHYLLERSAFSIKVIDDGNKRHYIDMVDGNKILRKRDDNKQFTFDISYWRKLPKGYQWNRGIWW